MAAPCLNEKLLHKPCFNRKKVSYALLLVLSFFLFIWTDPTPKTEGSIKVYDAKGKLMMESYGKLGSQQPVDFDRIPADLINAVIVAEDQRYYKHLGVDLVAVTRALAQNIKEKRVVSGASTIPQQVVRFTVISPYEPPKTNVVRKVRESLMAIRLSITTSKKQVMQRYLNTMHFGRKIYGVGSASKFYFGKEVQSLSLAEAATLASMIANPSRYDPINFPQESESRRNRILSLMKEEKLVSEEAYEVAAGEKLPDEMHNRAILSPHAAEMAIEFFKKLNIPHEGVSIYTTIDSDWYEISKNIAKNQVEKLKYEHDLSNASIVIIGNKTGRIISLLGSIDYFDEAIDGQNNMALALRQPGSAMKPVTYAAAFEKKIATAATPIDDVPKVYLTAKGEGFLPHNYDGKYRGRILAREALASSYNLPAVEILDRVGIETFLDLSHRMGVTSMNQVSRYDLALTLGGGEINLLELTNLYATFARGGIFLPTVLVEKIVSDDGKVIFENKKNEPKKVLDEKVAWLVTNILSDKKARMPTFGEKNSLVLSVPAAVKTGTTTDWHDNWTIGYTNNFTVGVWVGNADNRPMRDITGVTGAGPIWKNIFEELIKFEESGSFIQPSGIVELEVCSWDGLLPNQYCLERYKEYFIDGTQPTQATNLTEKPIEAGVAIINPTEGSTYEVGAAKDESIVFEVANDKDIISVEWFLDYKKLDCDTASIYICEWSPSVGKHNLSVQVLQENGKKTTIAPVHFEVLEYKSKW